MRDHQNLLDSPGKSLKDALHIATLLHGDDLQLVLLIHPHEEGLLLVVVDAPALRPVSLHSSGDQILVPRDEKEVIINQLLSDGLIHAREGDVGARQIILKLGKCIDHQLLKFETLLHGDTGGQTKAFNTTTNTDHNGLDRDIILNVFLDLVNVHVAGLDQWVKDLAGVLVPSIDAAELIVILDSASNGLGQGEP